MSNFLTTVVFSVVFFILGDVVGVDKIIQVGKQIISNFQ